jgi:hypothetical protein
VHWFKYVPERSQAEEQAAERLSLRRFDDFIEWTSLAMARNSRLVSKVLKDDAAPEPQSVKPGQPRQSTPR